MSIIERRLSELGITLPDAPIPIGVCLPAKTVGSLVFTSGQVCKEEGILKYAGKLGLDLTTEEGYKAAELSIINCLAVLKAEIGNLDRVKQIVKILGFVNSADGFIEQAYVINGASELLEKIFGDKGKHARSAISANELPFNTAVEIEMIVEISKN